MAITGRLIVSIEGYDLLQQEFKLLAHPLTAGVILFQRNYKDKEQLSRLTSSIKKFNLPIFVDHEGGHVQRFRDDFSPLPAVKIFGEDYDIEAENGLKRAFDYGMLMAKELVEFGIVSLAPVCDLDAGNKVITGLSRAFHKDPKICTALLKAYIEGMNAAGMQATGKHFPGHGQNIGDSHIGAITDGRQYEDIENADLQPFKTLIDLGYLKAIMPAHITYSEVDPEHTAGASKIWLKTILREKLNYTGVIVSDCLSMKGVKDSSLYSKTVAALKFGDVAILSRWPDDGVSIQDLIKLLDELQLNGFQQSQLGQKRFAEWVTFTTPTSVQSPVCMLHQASEKHLREALPTSASTSLTTCK